MTMAAVWPPLNPPPLPDPSSCVVPWLSGVVCVVQCGVVSVGYRVSVVLDPSVVFVGVSVGLVVSVGFSDGTVVSGTGVV